MCSARDVRSRLRLRSMAAPLPRLRADLDIMPSPLPEQPGLIVRDPFRFSEVTLLIPPLLARCLACFDGEQDEAELRATLARLSGQVAVARRRAAPRHVAARRRLPRRRPLRRAARRARAGVRGAGRARVGARGQRLPVGERRADRPRCAKYFNGATKAASEGEGQGGAAACWASPRRTSAPKGAAPATPPPIGRCRSRTATTIGSSSCSARRTTASPIASG